MVMLYIIKGFAVDIKTIICYEIIIYVDMLWIRLNEMAKRLNIGVKPYNVGIVKVIQLQKERQRIDVDMRPIPRYIVHQLNQTKI